MQNVEFTKLCDGVYKSARRGGPKTVTHEGQELFRFMDIFYVASPTENLTQEQMVQLCRARAEAADVIRISDANARIKEIFGKFVERSLACTVLEIGAGKSPACPSSSCGKEIVLADADPLVVKDYQGREGHRCVLFAETEALPFVDNYFDMAIAVFVFQFRLHQNQIAELSRCITDKGVLVTHVYRRSATSREDLAQQFLNEGFTVLREQDPLNLCAGNEYWVIGKAQRTLSKTMGDLLEIVRAP